MGLETRPSGCGGGVPAAPPAAPTPSLQAGRIRTGKALPSRNESLEKSETLLRPGNKPQLITQVGAKLSGDPSPPTPSPQQAACELG